MPKELTTFPGAHFIVIIKLQSSAYGKCGDDDNNKKQQQTDVRKKQKKTKRSSHQRQISVTQ